MLLEIAQETPDIGLSPGTNVKPRQPASIDNALFRQKAGSLSGACGSEGIPQPGFRSVENQA